MLRLRIAVVFTAAAFFSACGGKVAPDSGSNGGSNGGSTSNKPTDGSCPHEDVQYCPDDEPVSYDVVHACENELADATCGALYKSFLKCAELHITCNANGMTDNDAILGSCENEVTSYEQCTDQSPTHP